MPHEQIDWDLLESDVCTKLRLLRAAWQHSEALDAEIHAALKRDIYLPTLALLAKFCTCIEWDDVVG